MNWYAKRVLNAFACGCWMVLAIDAALASVRSTRPARPRVHAGAPTIDLALMDRARDLDDGAGVFHHFVGTDPFSCALCLTPETHPIHRVNPGA